LNSPTVTGAVVHEPGTPLQTRAMSATRLATRLRALVGDDGVVDHPDALRVYD